MNKQREHSNDGRPDESPGVCKEDQEYRAFISYAHDNDDIARQVAAALKADGIQPEWDQNFRFGHGFHDQIKMSIAHSHVFVPVITAEAVQRGWVHQEIGYAMAMNVPVLPVTVGEDVIPGQMIGELQALRVSRDDVKLRHQQLQRGLTRRVVSRLLRANRRTHRATFECATYPMERAVMLAEYAHTVYDVDGPHTVRQIGALSSFSIPNRDATDRIWKRHYHGRPRPREYYERLVEERKALADHARQAGCRLILNLRLDYGSYEESAPIVKSSRLRVLREFLTDMPPNSVRAAERGEHDEPHNLVIVGNWFSAESMSASFREGYRQTIFTRHAGTIQSAIESFDNVLESLLGEQGESLTNDQSREIVLTRIDEELQRLAALSPDVDQQP